MNKYEEKARKLHKDGKDCSYAIYNTFYKDDNNYPRPRSVDGMCGTVIAVHKILKELKKEECIEEFNNQFLEKFHSLKCLELIKNNMCNEYVGFSAKLLSEILSK